MWASGLGGLGFGCGEGGSAKAWRVSKWVTRLCEALRVSQRPRPRGQGQHESAEVWGVMGVDGTVAYIRRTARRVALV